MSNNPSDAPADDFLEQILELPNFACAESNLTGKDGGLAGTPSSQMTLHPSWWFGRTGKPGFLKPEESSGSGKRFRDDVLDGSDSSVKNVFHDQPIPTTVATAPHPATIRPRVRTRKLRRERIAERIRALQELVPSVNKTDRAVMLDEIFDYVKFLRLQVKVLSMSRLGGAGAVAPLVTEIPLSSVEEEGNEGGRNQPAWEKWSNDGTERQVAKLMEENVGAAMQFLQSKALCIMPISLASQSITRSHWTAQVS